MMLLLWLLGGLVLGVVAERLTGGGASRRNPADDEGAPTSTPRRRRRWGRILGWSAVAIVVLLVAGVVGGYLWANSIFQKIDRVDVSAQLAEGASSGTNYLLVGSDNGAADGEQRENVDGSRSDTMMILHVEDGSATMLSLNRDLWVLNPRTGENGRLNATYQDAQGKPDPANLIQAITENFGIPIHRYIEVDFVSFAGLVDSFGGIDIAFEHPAFDLASGLDVKEAGLVHLDGTQALAFVRSRHYAEVIDGEVVLEGGLPDVNRTQRQQAFLRAMMAKAGDNRNPITLAKAAEKMSDGLRIDDDMTLLQAARFAWDMGRLQPQTVVLPVTPRRTSGGADVLDLDQPEAEAILQQFR